MPSDNKRRGNGQFIMQLSDINSLFDGVATKEEIAQIVKSLTGEVKAITDELKATGDNSRSELQSELKGLRDDLELFIEQIKIFAEDNDLTQSELAQARSRIEAEYAALADKYAEMRHELDEMDTESMVRSIVGETENKLRTELAHKTPAQIRDELLSLPQGDRFPAQMISNWDDIEKEWSRVISLAATAQIEVLSNGEKVGSSHRMNFTSGATVTMEGGTLSVSIDGLPDQTGENGKFLTTDGTTASWATLAGGGDLLSTNNLSDLANAGTARTNLGLGDSATKNTGTTAGTVAAGDHNHTGVYAPALGADDNYVTDAEKIKLSNLSGTNTGDQDLSGYVTKATYDAQTILAATLDNTPAALPVAEQTVVGRVTGGNVATIAIDSDLSAVSANDDTIPSAKATKAALDAKAPLASPTFTGTVTLPVGLTGVIRADTGVVSVDSDVTDIVAAASDTAAGKVELATTAETETGTDATRAVTPDGLHDMTTLAGAAWFLDEDNMASDSAVKTASQQSIKAYADTKLPLAGGTMSGAITLGENTSIALDPAGSADGKYSGITVTGTGGATIAFGDLVTLDKDDSRWELVDISVAAAATGDARGVLGMAVTSSTDGGALTVLLNGIIRADANFPTLTIGAPVYASTTGDVVVTQPTTTDHVIRIVGYGLTADEMYFNPAGTWTTHT